MKKRNAVTDPAQLNMLLATIHEKAVDSTNIAFSEYSIKRAIERDISLSEAVRVLQSGSFSQPVTAGNNEYRFQMAYIIAGRLIAVQGVCKIDRSGRVFMITVFEMKGKRI